MLPVTEKPWVNDRLTHVAKSTGLLRAPANDALSEIARHIPEKVRGVKVEYDVSYESRGYKIAGYKMTDLFAKCLWIAPCNTRLAVERIAAIAAMHRSDEGLRVAAELQLGLEDKYLQRTIERVDLKDLKGIAVLPGSNLLARGVLDYAKLDEAVKAGAYIKPHPLTNARDILRLMQRYRERVLPFTGRLYPLVRAAKRVYFCTSSEVGLAAMLLSKPFTILDSENTQGPLTYHSLYAGIQLSHAHRASMRERLVSLLSYPQSGLISIYHDDYQRSVERYFNQFVLARHGE